MASGRNRKSNRHLHEQPDRQQVKVRETSKNMPLLMPFYFLLVQVNCRQCPEQEKRKACRGGRNGILGPSLKGIPALECHGV